jgi:thioesterase domain-containing protein
MSVPAFLADLRSRDVQVWADGDQLRCNAPAGMLTPELRDQLEVRKHDILEFLRSAEALAGQQRAIVPLQPRGERTPIFGVAGHNGDVFCYRALAAHLGADQPLYGLQPPGLDGHSEPLTRIEDIAAYFAAQIRAFRPNGPCIITGFCAGGMIAFELGRQLLQAGKVIGLLALFGAPFPTAYRFLPRLRQRLGESVERVVAHGRALASLSPGQRQLYLAERLRERKARSAIQPPTEPDEVLRLRAQVERATIAAARRYRPGYFAGRVGLFLPSKAWVRSGKMPLRWRSVAQHVEEYFGPDGCDGDNMLGEPYAPTFAELLRQSGARSTALEAAADT